MGLGIFLMVRGADRVCRFLLDVSKRVMSVLAVSSQQ